MTSKTHWTLLDSFPATVQPDNGVSTPSARQTSGTLHVEQPLTEPVTASDPHLKLSFQLPGEDDLQLSRTGQQQLHNLTDIAHHSTVDMRAQIPIVSPTGTQAHITCIVFPLPGRDAPPESFILSFERSPDPSIVVSFTPAEFAAFTSLLDPSGE